MTVYSQGGLMFRGIVVAASALVLATGSAAAKPPLEAFGDVPQIRAMELSPDGKKLAYLQRTDGDDLLIIRDLTTSTSKGLARVSEIRAKDVHFIGNEYVVLIASRDTRTVGFRGRYEFSAAFAFDLATGRSMQLLLGTNDLFPAQSGLGRIIGVDPAGKEVFMPAYMGVSTTDPANHLLRVSLGTGRGRKINGGTGVSSTINWLVDGAGNVVIREDFSEQFETHEISSRQADGQWKEIYHNKSPLPAISAVGLSQDRKSVYVVDSGDSEFLSLHAMSLADGAMTGPVLQRDDAEVVGLVSDLNRVVHGVRYSGMYPSYDMFDPALDADINSVIAALPGSAVYLDSWSDDWSSMLFLVDGGQQAERYVLYERAKRNLRPIANLRPDIKPADVGEVVTVAYKARDGLPIPSLITWPAGVAQEDRKKLPLVVLPHGGPQAYDAVGFDWIAQFLANEGYLVLQPNFRGSAGFGESFTAAGYREWGRKMQDDITDGANALVKMGWADPERICIVGWSYGGYAALAGGALTPDLYKCVASVAGVSNLRQMLTDEGKQHGEDSRTVTYWKLLIGDPDEDRDAIDAVSPELLAGKFKAPVLLFHGTSDTVVPAKQSDMMNDALRKAGKQVQYIRIDGDDHSLVDNESRRKMLTALAAFLQTHIGK